MEALTINELHNKESILMSEIMKYGTKTLKACFYEGEIFYEINYACHAMYRKNLKDALLEYENEIDDEE